MTRLSSPASSRKAALLLQHADHFKFMLVDHDFLAQRRFLAEQIGGHVVADDADRPAAFTFRRGQKPALASVKPLVNRN